MKTLHSIAIASILGLFLASNAFAQYDDGYNYATVNYADQAVLLNDNFSLPYSTILYYYDRINDMSGNIYINLDPAQCGLYLEQHNSYMIDDTENYYNYGATTTMAGGFTHTFLRSDNNGSDLTTCLHASNTPIINFGSQYEYYTGYHWTLFSYSTSTSAMQAMHATMIDNPLQMDLNYETDQQSFDATNADNNVLILWLSDRTGDYFHKNDGYIDPYYIKLYLQPDQTFSFSEYIPIEPPNNNVYSCNPFSTDITHAFLNTDFNLKNCIGDIFSWLFTPSDSISAIEQLKDQVKNKPPFGYFAIITNGLSDLTATSTATSTVDNIVIPAYLKTYIFDPLKTGLSVLLWFILLVFLFNRLKHIQL